MNPFPGLSQHLQVNHTPQLSALSLSSEPAMVGLVLLMSPDTDPIPAIASLSDPLPLPPLSTCKDPEIIGRLPRESKVIFPPEILVSAQLPNLFSQDSDLLMGSGD